MKRGILKSIAVVLLPLLMAACEHEAIDQVTPAGTDVKLDLLFEHDGCKVYRFNDGGYFIYWSDCRGKMEHHVTVQGYRWTNTIKMQTVNS